MSPARSAAEVAGTFGLVFLGTGACALDHASGGALGGLGVALAFGLAVWSMAALTGAQMNPAASLALCVADRQPWAELAPLTAAQLAGALAASLSLQRLFGPAGGELGATLPRAGVPAAFAAEALMTFLLLLAVLRAPARWAPAVAGAMVAVEAFVGGPISGASMNPARSLAPGLVSGAREGLWLYLAAPALGSLAAAWTERLRRLPTRPELARIGGR